MKLILIAAATLMTGAGVYGLSDYSSASSKKEFNEMYAAKKEMTNPVKEKRTIPEKTDAVHTVKTDALKKEVKAKKEMKKKTVRKAKLSSESFSRAKLERP